MSGFWPCPGTANRTVGALDSAPSVKLVASKSNAASPRRALGTASPGVVSNESRSLRHSRRPAVMMESAVARPNRSAMVIAFPFRTSSTPRR